MNYLSRCYYYVHNTDISFLKISIRRRMYNCY
nr:MAG TPA: hypothetical protein [Caudoviricetes sp.]